MRKRIGEFLLERGLVNESQINQILKYSQENNLRFGEAGLALGIYTREKLIEVFGPSFAVDFFYLEPAFFPKITQDLLPLEAIVRLGVLPLGFKTENRFFKTRKIVNLGLLEPARQEAAEEALRLVCQKTGAGEVHGAKVFLILADQFLSVLKQVYGVDDASLRAKEPQAVDPTLSMFLGSGV